MSRERSVTLVMAIALICVPTGLAAFEAIAFYLANRSSHAITSSGLKREYTLYVPPGYDAHRPAPLVISLHGAAMWPAAQQDTSQWNRVADREGFLVAYPSGRTGLGPRIWTAEDGGHDVQFISDLIDAIGASYAIDRTRVFANGLSNGGGMSFLLSCTIADRIAAVGFVAAAQLVPWNRCGDMRPMPMIAFHGTADPDTPYQGGKTAIAPVPFPSIPEWTARFARRNRCATSPDETRIAADVTRSDYSGCAGDADVVLYTIHGGGHTWPGGGYLPAWFVGPNTHSIDASSVMWEFFKAHPLMK
jgi:polyhydroxybutyrate depolymerase